MFKRRRVGAQRSRGAGARQARRGAGAGLRDEAFFDG
jgi:hypothetical protein